MESREHTTIVIAHRLWTVAASDRIAFIADGKVLEFGTPTELLQKKHGRYKRLVDSQRRGATLEALLAKTEKGKEEEEDDDDKNAEQIEEEVEENTAFSAQRARQLASPEIPYMELGSAGAIMAGGVFPVWGILFAQTIDLLSRRVEACPEPIDGNITAGYSSCEDCWSKFADGMQQRSFVVGAMRAGLLLDCLIGFTIMYVGFGGASERISRRVRNDAFQGTCEARGGLL